MEGFLKRTDYYGTVTFDPGMEILDRAALAGIENPDHQHAGQAAAAEHGVQGHRPGQTFGFEWQSRRAAIDRACKDKCSWIELGRHSGRLAQGPKKPAPAL